MPDPPPPPGHRAHPPPSAARRVRYLSRVLDASFNVLFDGRRRTAHTLVYNYFMVRLGGGRRLALKCCVW